MSTSPSQSATETGPVYLNFIGGEWKNACSGETFVSTNPARTSEIIGQYQKSVVTLEGGERIKGRR